MCEVSSSDFTDYLAMFELEPWGAQIEDLRAGTLVSMLANIHRDSAKRPTPFGALDFFPWAADRDPANDEEPVLLDDPKEQAALIRAALYRR